METQPVLDSRPPAYVSCARLAWELDVSESTIRSMVDRGILPRPLKLGSSVRWSWVDVQRALGGISVAAATSSDDPYLMGAVHATTARKG